MSIPIPDPLLSIDPRRWTRRLPWLLLCALVLVQGCGWLSSPKSEYVYVSVSHAFLRDRVAAVSNRVAEVENGQQLQVVERGRRWVRVKTAKKEIGWMEERDVIDEKVYDAFVHMADAHKQDPVTATAVLNSDLSMRIAPGRDKQRFYLIPEKSKVELLAKASAPKVSVPIAAVPAAKPPAPKDASPANASPKVSSNDASKATPAAPAAGANAPGTAAATAKPGSAASQKSAPSPAPGSPASGAQGPAKPAPNNPAEAASQPAAPEPAPPPQMEDWWLARDQAGHVGWLLGKELDADVPVEIEAYGEGQRFIGAWPFAKVNDPKARSADPKSADREITEYLTVMSPPQSGQPFDFDQVRLFTWNRRWHRYESAFRLHPIQGFLPVRIFTRSTPEGEVPAFSFLIAGDGKLKLDTDSGIARPTAPRTIEYALIDDKLVRYGADLGPIPVMHENEKRSGDKKGKEGKGNRKKRK